MRNTGEQGTAISLPASSARRLLPADDWGGRPRRCVGLFTVPVSAATACKSPRDTSRPTGRPVIRPSGYSASAYL